MRLSTFHIASDKFFDIACLIRLRFYVFIKHHVSRKKSNCKSLRTFFSVFCRSTSLGFSCHGKLLTTRGNGSRFGGAAPFGLAPLFHLPLAAADSDGEGDDDPPESDLDTHCLSFLIPQKPYCF